MTVAKKYMGTNMGDILILCLMVKMVEKGFKYSLSNAINEKAKALTKRMDTVVRYFYFIRYIVTWNNRCWLTCLSRHLGVTLCEQKPLLRNLFNNNAGNHNKDQS